MTTSPEGEEAMQVGGGGSLCRGEALPCLGLQTPADTPSFPSFPTPPQPPALKGYVSLGLWSLEP